MLQLTSRGVLNMKIYYHLHYIPTESISVQGMYTQIYKKKNDIT